MTGRTPTLIILTFAGAGVCVLVTTLNVLGARDTTQLVRLFNVAAPWPLAAVDDLVGTKLPEMAFERWIKADVDGKSRMTGVVTLYRWWTDGCPHCEKTLPAVEALRKQYGPKGLRVVAVYHPKPVREVDDAAVRAAAGRMGYGGAIALDADWSELKKFYLDTGDRPATSASFLVDRDGVIRFVHPGPRFYPSDDPASAAENEDYGRLEAAVKRLVESSH